jgi:hypothetical protein
LNEEEKEQGYALAVDEIEREKDRLADQQDVLLRVETIHTVRSSTLSSVSLSFFLIFFRRILSISWG